MQASIISQRHWGRIRERDRGTEVVVGWRPTEHVHDWKEGKGGEKIRKPGKKKRRSDSAKPGSSNPGLAL